jgi:hypothetical protein
MGCQLTPGMSMSWLIKKPSRRWSMGFATPS